MVYNWNAYWIFFLRLFRLGDQSRHSFDCRYFIVLMLLSTPALSQSPCGPTGCGDNNPCTIDLCIVTAPPNRDTICRNTPRNCSDGNICTEDSCGTKSTFPFWECLHSLDCCCRSQTTPLIVLRYELRREKRRADIDYAKSDGHPFDQAKWTKHVNIQNRRMRNGSIPRYSYN